MQDRLKRWIMGHWAYGASSSLRVPEFPPNLSCAAFHLVSSVKKKKISSVSTFFFIFICTFVSRLKSSTTSETSGYAARPSPTRAESLSGLRDSGIESMHTIFE